MLIPRVSSFREGGHWRVQCVLGGRPVSWLVINDLHWRIGSAIVRIGGIGGVGTLTEHRRRGYSRRCMDEAMALMEREHLPMAALFGIPDFYVKWGFAPVIPEPALAIATTDAAGADRDPRWRVVRFDRTRHARAALAMSRANNRDRSGTIVPAAWRTPVRTGSDWGIRSEGAALVDRQGRLAAYAAHDVSRTALTVTEVGWRSPAVFPTLTRELAHRAARRRAATIRLFLPPDHPYAWYLRRWNVHHTVSYYATGQGMARIVDLEGTLARCAGELTRRLAASRFARWTGALGLATDLGGVTLRITSGRVTIQTGKARGRTVRVNQARLTQWLMGYRPVAAGGFQGPARAAPLLAALFPAGHPYLWRSDRF